MTASATVQKPKTSDGAATALALVGALFGSVVIGIGAGVLVVWLWYSVTKTDAIGVFFSVLLGLGLFANLVGFAAIVRRHHMPSPYSFCFALLPWVAFGTYATWGTCKDWFITWDNWRWILKSGDQRVEVLNWIIRGWQSIAVAAILGLLASSWILARQKATAR